MFVMIFISAFSGPDLSAKRNSDLTRSVFETLLVQSTITSLQTGTLITC